MQVSLANKVSLARSTTIHNSRQRASFGASRSSLNRQSPSKPSSLLVLPIDQQISCQLIMAISCIADLALVCCVCCPRQGSSNQNEIDCPAVRAELSVRAEGGFDFDSALASLADKWVHLRCFSSPKQLHLLLTSGFFAKGSQCCVM